MCFPPGRGQGWDLREWEEAAEFLEKTQERDKCCLQGRNISRLPPASEIRPPKMSMLKAH